MEMHSGHCEHMHTSQWSFSGHSGPTVLQSAGNRAHAAQGAVQTHPSASIDSMMLLKNLFYRQDVFPFLPDPPVPPLLRLFPAAAHGLPQPRHLAHLPHRITGAVREDRFALHSGGCTPPHSSASRAFSGERRRGHALIRTCGHGHLPPGGKGF